MNNLKQFQEYFTKRCCVQFREAMALCRMKLRGEPSASSVVQILGDRVVQLSKSGAPTGDQKEAAVAPTWPIEAQQARVGSEDRFVYVMMLEDCLVVPGQSGERITLGYREGYAALEISVDPKDILAITTVSQVEKAPLITQ